MLVRYIDILMPCLQVVFQCIGIEIFRAFAIMELVYVKYVYFLHDVLKVQNNADILL